MELRLERSYTLAADIQICGCEASTAAKGRERSGNTPSAVRKGSKSQ
jgi:hypothetical protein